MVGLAEDGVVLVEWSVCSYFIWLPPRRDSDTRIRKRRMRDWVERRGRNLLRKFQGFDDEEILRYFLLPLSCVPHRHSRESGVEHVHVFSEEPFLYTVYSIMFPSVCFVRIRALRIPL